jgi:hypothetical protein
VSEVSDTEESGMPFIGQRGGYGRVSWGGRARWSRVKRRKGECCWGWSHAVGNLERLPARQDKEGTRIQRGAEGRAAMALPRFSGQVSVRGGKGREGRATGSSAGFLEQVGCLGTPGLVAHLQIRKWQDSTHQVFDKMAARI